jgi:hypothetical protein
MLLKNTGSQGVYIYAYVIATGAADTGDAANITGYYSLDDGAATVFATANPTEVSSTHMAGVYWQPLAQAETNGNAFAYKWASSTSGVAIDPIIGFTSGVNLPAVAAGAANGLLIAGSNTGPMSISGGVTFSNSSGDALALTSTGSNGNGLNASGNGTADGIRATGGATGRGIHGLGGATSGAGMRLEAQGGTSHGLHALGFGAGNGFEIDAGATGNGLNVTGGSTSGIGFAIATTSGDGLSILPTAGNAITATANGTSKHGAVFTGGTAGTSDGLKAVAGTGGVDFRASTSGPLQVNLTTIAGVALSTSTAQIGVNVVQFGGHAAVLDANNYPGVNVVDVAGAAASYYTGQAVSTGTGATGIGLSASDTAPIGAYVGRQISLVGGTGAGQWATITAHTGTVGTAVVTTYCPGGSGGHWITTPDSTTLYSIDGGSTGPFKIGQANNFLVALYETDNTTPYTSAASGITVTRTIGTTDASAGGTLTQVGATNKYVYAGVAADYPGPISSFTFSATGMTTITIPIPCTP